MSSVNLLDTSTPIPHDVLFELEDLLRGLTSNPAWPVLIQLIRRNKLETLAVEIHVDQHAARLAGIDDGVEMAIQTAEKLIAYSMDVKSTLLAQEAARKTALSTEPAADPGLSL